MKEKKPGKASSLKTTMMTTKSPRATRIRLILVVTAAVLAGLDLVLKAFAEAALVEEAEPSGGLISLNLHYNTGVAFSLGAGLPDFVVLVITGLITAALSSYLLVAAPRLSRTALTGAALVLGGAIGNLIDRLAGSGVVDYLHTGWFPTFNLADVFVVTGAITLALGAMKANPASRPSEEASGTAH